MGKVPSEYVDYVLMTQLWHCPPSLFEQQPQEIIELHTLILEEEIKADKIVQKRAEQNAKK